MPRGLAAEDHGKGGGGRDKHEAREPHPLHGSSGGADVGGARGAMKNDHDIGGVHPHWFVALEAPLHIVFYSTGHGFGHASRDFEVARALHRLAPHLVLHVRTTVAPWFIEASLADVPHTVSAARLDVGICQPDSVTQDIAATTDACEALIAQHETLVAAERDFLRATGARLVVSDIPAIPFAAARELQIPALALGNFTWSWIYRHLVSEAPRLAAVADAFDADYACADALLRLPFHGADAVAAPFPSVCDLPMVARRSALERAEAKRRLALDPQQPAVLVSFGGLGPSSIDIDALAHTRGYTFVLTPPGPHITASNLRCVEPAEMADRGLRFEDLVRACDIVASKPGYGIVSECIANETRLLYTSRGAFAEYPVLVEGIETHGVARFIDNDRLASGRWGADLDALMATPARACTLPTDGAEVAARVLLERLS